VLPEPFAIRALQTDRALASLVRVNHDLVLAVWPLITIS